MKITIPGQPKAQKRHRTGGGRTYDPSRKDKASLRRALLPIKPTAPLGGPIEITIRAYFRTPKSWSNAKIQRSEGQYRPKTPDVDNIEKILFDAMNGMIFGDDNQVVASTTEKFYSVKPRTEIEIKPIQLP